MNIFVGNLSFDATETDVRNLFRSFGEITSVAIVMDKNGRKSRGFGFVQMPDDQQAQTAISTLNGKEIKGRPLNVSSATSELGPSKDSRRKSGYKQGRRSRSFVRRRRSQAASELKEKALPDTN
jgi:RNA recognition motif-containing protein